MNYTHPTAIIGPNVTLGDNVYIGPYCVIGTHAEYRSRVDERRDRPGAVVIGDNVTIREFVTIHGGSKSDDHTFIGSNCYIQAHAHIGHDAKLLGTNTIACHAIVAGLVIMDRFSQLGLAAVTHQNAIIGAGAFIGASAFFKGEAEPFTIYAGVPARPIGPNARLAQSLRDQGQGLLIPDWISQILDDNPTGSSPSSHPSHTDHTPPPVLPCDPSL